MIATGNFIPLENIDFLLLNLYLYYSCIINMLFLCSSCKYPLQGVALLPNDVNYNDTKTNDYFCQNCGCELLSEKSNISEYKYEMVGIYQKLLKKFEKTEKNPVSAETLKKVKKEIKRRNINIASLTHYQVYDILKHFD